MVKTESPAFDYLKAEMGISNWRQLNKNTLPVGTYRVFLDAFEARQEIDRIEGMTELENMVRMAQDPFDGIKRVQNIVDLLEYIKVGAKLLLAIRQGYKPIEIPDDQYVGAVLEPDGFKNFLKGDVRSVTRLATQSMRAFNNNLPPELEAEYRRARETGFFYTYLVSSPAPYSFFQGGGMPPNSALYGVLKCYGQDLRITNKEDGTMKKGARVNNGVVLEIARIGINREVIPAIDPNRGLEYAPSGSFSNH